MRRAWLWCVPACVWVFLQRLLQREDTVSAVAGQAEGRATTFAPKAVTAAEVDALFARLPDYDELTLPLRHNHRAAEERAAIEERWMEKYAEYLESGEAPGYFGTLMRERYYWT